MKYYVWQVDDKNIWSTCDYDTIIADSPEDGYLLFFIDNDSNMTLQKDNKVQILPDGILPQQNYKLYHPCKYLKTKFD